MPNTIHGSGGSAKYIGDAVESNVLKGKKFYSSDKTLRTGTIPSLSAKTYTPTTTNQTISSGQYINGTQTILGSSELVSENIVSDATIFGVKGSATKVTIDGVSPTITNLALQSRDLAISGTKFPKRAIGGVNVYGANGLLYTLGYRGDEFKGENIYSYNGSSWSELSAELKGYFMNGAGWRANDGLIHVIYDDGDDSEYHDTFDGTSTTALTTPAAVSRVACYNKQTDTGYVAESSLYGYTNNVWTKIAVLPFSTNSGPGSIIMDKDNVLNILGDAYPRDDHNKKHYKLVGTTWTSVSTLPKVVDSGCCQVDFDGNIGIFRGYTGIYKYKNNTWTITGKNSAVDDDVYVSGGYQDGNPIIAVGGFTAATIYSNNVFTFETGYFK